MAEEERGEQPVEMASGGGDTRMTQVELERQFRLREEKYRRDLEMGKQRENKLMFFLYVLKEEKKCPVSQVFEEYIKPLETSRFSPDYAVDYRKVLNKVKRQNRHDRIYNKALKKIKLVSCHKDYKSDSCLPDLPQDLAPPPRKS